MSSSGYQVPATHEASDVWPIRGASSVRPDGGLAAVNGWLDVAASAANWKPKATHWVRAAFNSRCAAEIAAPAGS